MTDAINHQEIYDFMVDVARRAGDMIYAAQPHVNTSSSKLNSVDLVTETDRAVEKFAIGELKGAYPGFEFLGEETYAPGMKLTDKPTFVCDPIDGTTNFVHAFPNVCISLALCVRKKPVVGVIYNPYTMHLYSAIKDQGSWLTMPARGDPVDPRAPTGPCKIKLPRKSNPEPLTGLQNALVAVEWGSERSGPNFEVKHRTFTRLAGAKESSGMMVHSIRSMGSAALNLCYVASGQLDLYWEGGCWAWDVAAGWLVLTEAGGIVVGGNPGEWSPEVDCRRYLAIRGAPSGQKEMVEEFWAAIEGELRYSV